MLKTTDVPPAQGSVLPSGAGFAQWVKPSIPAMWRLISRMGEGLDREEILQDALLRAWQKHHHFDETRGSATSWLIAIAYDQVRQTRRRDGRRPATVNLDTVLDRPSRENGHDLDLERAIGDLPDRQRMAFECAYLIGLSIDETAAVMDCRPGTVKSALSDARAGLRRRLEEHAGE